MPSPWHLREKHLRRTGTTKLNSSSAHTPLRCISGTPPTATSQHHQRGVALGERGLNSPEKVLTDSRCQGTEWGR